MVNLNLLLAICSFVSVTAFMPAPWSHAVVRVNRAGKAKASATTSETVIAATNSDHHFLTFASQNTSISHFSAWNQGLKANTHQIKTSTVEEDPLFGLKTLKIASSKNVAPHALILSTWKRRLDTPQDPFNIHKWAGLGWWLSSTAIVGVGASSGFTQVPAIMEPITHVFLISTVLQSLTSIPMAVKYRRHEPSVKRGFISSAITSSSLALTGYWFSPLFTHSSIGPELAAGFIAFLVIADVIYSLSSFPDMNALVVAINEMDPVKEAHSLPEKYTALISTVPIGLPMNAFLLQKMYGHLDTVREVLLGAIITHGGSTSEFVFYAFTAASIAVSISGLAVTLHHRKLISKDMMNLALLDATAVPLVFFGKVAGAF